MVYKEIITLITRVEYQWLHNSSTYTLNKQFDLLFVRKTEKKIILRIQILSYESNNFVCISKIWII